MEDKEETGGNVDSMYFNFYVFYFFIFFIFLFLWGRLPESG